MFIIDLFLKNIHMGFFLSFMVTFASVILSYLFPGLQIQIYTGICILIIIIVLIRCITALKCQNNDLIHKNNELEEQRDTYNNKFNKKLSRRIVESSNEANSEGISCLRGQSSAVKIYCSQLGKPQVLFTPSRCHRLDTIVSLFYLPGEHYTPEFIGFAEVVNVSNESSSNEHSKYLTMSIIKAHNVELKARLESNDPTICSHTVAVPYVLKKHIHLLGGI